MPNITTLKELFAGLPHPEILFFNPANLEKYEQYVTKRFMRADEKNNASLPPSFWGMMDDDEFKKFCQTRRLTPRLKKIIESYGHYALQSSEERLAELQKNFDNVLVVEI